VVHHERIIDTERRVLAFLCQTGDEASQRRRARELLAGYRWSDGSHQAVFDILMCFPLASPEALRDQLPARLTRRGFPDFDFDSLFSAPAPSPSDAEELMRELTQAR
jgi:hypothetical protein